MKTRRPKQTTKELFAEVDKLIEDLSKAPAIPTQSPGDRYFDEIIEMLNETEKHPLPTVTVEDEDNSFMQELLDELAEQEENNEEKQALDTLLKSAEKDYESQRKRHQDNLRTANQLIFIQTLVKQLPLWSPARNKYIVIFNNTEIEAHSKVKALIQTADDIAKEYRNKQSGFFSTQIFGKANRIHEIIAHMDLNAEPVDLAKLGFNP